MKHPHHKPHTHVYSTPPLTNDIAPNNTAIYLTSLRTPLCLPNSLSLSNTILLNVCINDWNWNPSFTTNSLNFRYAITSMILHDISLYATPSPSLVLNSTIRIPTSIIPTLSSLINNPHKMLLITLFAALESTYFIPKKTQTFFPISHKIEYIQNNLSPHS